MVVYNFNFQQPGSRGRQISLSFQSSLIYIEKSQANPDNTVRLCLKKKKKKKKSKKNKKRGGIKKLFSSLELWLLFQRSRILFPAST